MPSIINLETTGLRRSPHIAAKEPEKNHSSLSCNTIMKCFCVFGVAMTSLWTPGESSLYCQTQKLVFVSVNTFHSANQFFDSTLNALHPMALLAGKENNDSYTFEQILKQPDTADFIHAMIKEADDHESRDHWDVVPRWEKPPNVKEILAIWAFKWKRFQMGALINTRHGYVLMVECSSMESITGKITHQQ